MVTEKQVTVKLWFNLSTRLFYVQLGETLIVARDTMVTAIQEREQIEIVHVKDVREIQFPDRFKK